MHSFRSLALIGLIVVILAASTRTRAAEIDQINIYSFIAREDGVIVDHRFAVQVDGTGITSLSFQDQTTSVTYALTEDSGSGLWTYTDGGYATLGDLYAVHGNPTNYLFDINGGADAVLLGFAHSEPTDYVHITFPPDNGTGVTLDPTFTWETYAGDADALGFRLLNDTAGVEVESYIPTGTTDTSWTPSTLSDNTIYTFEAVALNYVGGSGLDLATLHGDAFQYFGLVIDSNVVTFTTSDPGGGEEEVPEPATLALFASASAAGAWIRRRRRRKS
jgi:hypothetical protein